MLRFHLLVRSGKVQEVQGKSLCHMLCRKQETKKSGWSKKSINSLTCFAVTRLEFSNSSSCLSALPGHLSSSSIYPVCLAPYLIVTTCSDSRVRFWHCAVECDDGYSEDDQENRVYRWEPWALMNEEEDNNSAVAVSGRPVAVSCSYTGRLAVAFKKPRQGQVADWNVAL